MANKYYMDLAIKGRKASLDELEKILQQEIDEGQTMHEYYTMHKSIKRMGFNPADLDIRAYTEQVQRMDDNNLSVIYVGAWSHQPDVLKCIRKKWPDVTIDWQGVDEFGQFPETNNPSLVGMYKIEDEEEGVNPFSELPEWVTEEEALPVINEYYHTNCTSIYEAAETIDKLSVSDMMEPSEDDDSDKSFFSMAVDYLKEELGEDDRAVIEAQATVAWNHHMPIQTDYDDQIEDLLREFGECYDLPEDWWANDYDLEDFIKEL